MDYQEGLKTVKRGLFLLGAITILEVLFALIGNGHIFHGVVFPKWVMFPVMVVASLYKAYWIVYNFMHMAHEVKGLAASVLLPMLLLVWAVIAFFYEGSAWKGNRQTVDERDAREAKPTTPATGDVFDLSKMKFLS